MFLSFFREIDFTKKKKFSFSCIFYIVFYNCFLFNENFRLIQEEKQTTEQRAEELESRVGSVEHMNLLLQQSVGGSGNYNSNSSSSNYRGSNSTTPLPPTSSSVPPPLPPSRTPSVPPQPPPRYAYFYYGLKIS